MDSLKEILESAGLPAQRGVYSGEEKPEAYYTYLRITKGAAASADDHESCGRELYRVTLFHKGNFEEQLDKTLKVLRAADAYINGVDTEHLDTDTGYWEIPITIEILKE